MAQANPPTDLNDPSRTNVVRTGLTGRERLGTPDEMEAVVLATVVDAATLPSGVRFFPASFPLLSRIATRKFCYGVAFHGFSKQPDDADFYIGGGAPGRLKRAIRSALQDANLPLQIRIVTADDNPKFQGCSADNLINRLAAQGIHIEQSGEARKFSENIAKAIATVYRSPIR